MSGPLDIELKDDLLFIKSILIPSFDPDNKLTTSKKQKNWMKRKAKKNQWDMIIAAELISRYGTVESLEEAKAERAKAERMLEKEAEKESKQGIKSP